MISIKNIAQIFALVLIGLYVSSCSSDGRAGKNRLEERKDSILPPVIIPAGKPYVQKVALAAAPPDTIDLSITPIPEKVEAGFYINMENFNTQQGLALSSIICSEKDRFGNLWFGSSGNGLSRFDGHSFTNFTSAHGLIHNFIQTLLEDQEGNIWTGTYGGASKYDGVSFQNFTVENGLIDNDVEKIFQDSKGTIWFGTAIGVCRYTPDSTAKEIVFESFAKAPNAPKIKVRDIIESRTGRIWMAGSDGVFCYDPDAEARGELPFTNYSDKFNLNNQDAKAIVEDADGVIWVGTTGAVCRFKPARSGFPEMGFDPIYLSDVLVDKAVRSIISDSRGQLWIATKGGVARYNKKNDNFIYFTQEQGLATNRVNCIIEDDQGSLWFGTHGGGINRYDGERMIEYSKKQGLPGNAVFAMNRDRQGDLWFAPSGIGIVDYSQNAFSPYHGTYTFYTQNQGLLSDTYHCTAIDSSGNLYFGCYGGFSKFEAGKIINYTEKNGVYDKNITGMHSSKSGKLWLGSYDGGASVFDGESFTTYSTDQGLVHRTVWSILEDDKGVIWIATRGGLSRYDGVNFMNFTVDQGLADTKLSDVIQDKNGNILIGTFGGGISIIKKEQVEKLMHSDLDLSQPIFENFNTANGLANDVVYQILEDDSGNIIIGSNVGFTVLKGGIASAKGEIAKNGFENFNENTGYPVKDISNNYSMHLGEPGVIWAGTSDKVVRFDYSSIPKSSEQSQLILQNIKINNEPISWRSLEWVKKNKKKIPYVENATAPYRTDELLTFNKKITTTALNQMIDKYSDVKFDSIQKFYAIPKNLELPYDDNNITIEFTEVRTTRPQLVRYQYMLEGYDEDWSLETEKNTASYGNMREGKYTFKVRGKTINSKWGEPLNYSFSVRPPWYRTWYAYTLYVLATLLALYFFDSYLSDRLLRKERQKRLHNKLEHAKEIEKAYTELKATQVQLVHSEKMASLGQLTAGIAHEIKNPLNFVTNFSEVSSELLDEMKEEMDNGNYEEAKEIANDVKENLKKINNHGKRADAIVKGMLQHSRTSKGVKEFIDVNALCDEYLRLAYHGLRAKDKSFNAIMETEFDSHIGKVEIVPQDIGRVVLNLITNAFYACSEKGKLLAAANDGEGTAVSFQPTVTVGTKKIHQAIEISVRDNGNGIPDEIKEKIFQPFFTTKPSGEGTGLGLSLSYDIITAHHGELKVETEKGKFTEFKILLPTNNMHKK